MLRNMAVSEPGSRGAGASARECVVWHQHVVRICVFKFGENHKCLWKSVKCLELFPLTYVCVHMCMCVHACACLHMCVHVNVFVYKCVHIHTHSHAPIWVMGGVHARTPQNRDKQRREPGSLGVPAAHTLLCRISLCTSAVHAGHLFKISCGQGLPLPQRQLTVPGCVRKKEKRRPF